MARFEKLPEPMRSHLAALSCPTFETSPWVLGPPLSRRRVAIISTAGLHRRGDRPYEGSSGNRSPGGPGFDRWFWHEAAAGGTLRLVREACRDASSGGATQGSKIGDVQTSNFKTRSFRLISSREETFR